MKRILAIFAFCLLLLSTACAPTAATTATAAPAAATQEAVSTPAPTPEQTAEASDEPLGNAPIDLLGEGYNLFLDQTFPSGYTIYGARFDSADPRKGRNDCYVLYLTAEGDRAEITRYCAELYGITDEAIQAGYADSITNNGFVEISGVYAGKPAHAWLKQTEAGQEYDLCTDVDGCRVELSIDLANEQAEPYRALTLANYSTAMLGDLANQFGEDTIRRDMLCIFVDLQKPDKTEVYVGHAVPDAASLMAEMLATLQPSWADEAYASLGIDYAMQRLKYAFDMDGNTVNVTLAPNDNTAPAGEFLKSAVSFTGLGFTSYPNDGLCIYKEDWNHLEIAIAKPDWGHNEDWNFEFLGESNGCSLGMWYTEATGLFHVGVSKGGEDATAEYAVAENAFTSDFYPDEETQKRLFSEAAGVTEGDHRMAVFALFEQAVQERFGMTWQELYALPIW